MAKKKNVTKSKSNKVVKASKAASKADSKSKKSAKSSLASSVVKLASKVVKGLKPAKVDKVKKTSVSVKPKETLKVTKTVAKAKKSEEPQSAIKETPKSAGSTLIEMAKQEMSAVKIGQSPEKVEKTSKFKPIKVERGNLSDEKAKWQELNKRYGKEKAQIYKMTDIYEPLSPLQHKVLGWGFVLTNDNDRLEVLFENGIKMLISNYKPN